jgi:hypothetical protein
VPSANNPIPPSLPWPCAASRNRFLGLRLLRGCSGRVVFHDILNLRTLEQSETHPLRCADGSVAPDVDCARTACGKSDLPVEHRTGIILQHNANALRPLRQIAQVQLPVNIRGSPYYWASDVRKDIRFQVRQGKPIPLQNQLSRQLPSKRCQRHNEKHCQNGRRNYVSLLHSLVPNRKSITLVNCPPFAARRQRHFRRAKDDNRGLCEWLWHFDRRTATELHRIFAPEHDVVNHTLRSTRRSTTVAERVITGPSTAASGACRR